VALVVALGYTGITRADIVILLKVMQRATGTVSGAGIILVVSDGGSGRSNDCEDDEERWTNGSKLLRLDRRQGRESAHQIRVT
jgi:hypothetical protein